VPDDQLVEILETIGWMDRLKGVGAINEVTLAPRVKGPKSFESLEDAREEILQGLYDKAKAGDAQAARAFADISSENAPVDRFNIEVNVTPAKVPDEMLGKCMLDAVPFHIDAGLEGLEQRMLLDEAPSSLKALGKQFRSEFMAWCETAYAPKDA
jgi:hypothetical protein